MKENINKLKNRLSDARTLGKIKDFPLMRIFPSRNRGINRNLEMLKLVNGKSSNRKTDALGIILPMKSPMETIRKDIGTNKSVWKGVAFDFWEFTESVTETIAGKIVKLTNPTRNKVTFDDQSFFIKPEESNAEIVCEVAVCCFNGSNEFDKEPTRNC